MVSGYYKLDENKNAVPVKDLSEFDMMDLTGRIVGRTSIGDLLVSTVFLVLDHGLGLDRPVLFETMIFVKNGDGSCDETGNTDGDFCRRYSTWQEAVEGHEETCRLVAELNSKQGD